MLIAFQKLARREKPADAQEWFKARFKMISAPDSGVFQFPHVISAELPATG
jgi:hypothetical protein